eukprot:tig00001041_g6549.t1
MVRSVPSAKAVIDAERRRNPGIGGGADLLDPAELQRLKDELQARMDRWLAISIAGINGADRAKNAIYAIPDLREFLHVHVKAWFTQRRKKLGVSSGLWERMERERLERRRGTQEGGAGAGAGAGPAPSSSSSSSPSSPNPSPAPAPFAIGGGSRGSGRFAPY